MFAVGKPSVRPSLFAVLDLADDGVRARQQLGGTLGVGVRQQRADTGRGDLTTGVGNRSHDFGAEAMLRAQPGQCRDIARPFDPEGEVVAADDTRRADAPGQPLGAEALRGLGRQRMIEGQHHRAVDAERLEQVQPLPDPGERERWRVGAEQPRRVRVEGRNQGRTTLGPRLGQRPPDHRLVPEVKAVEVAERDDAAAQRIGHDAPSDDALHGGACSGPPVRRATPRATGAARCRP